MCLFSGGDNSAAESASSMADTQVMDSAPSDAGPPMTAPSSVSGAGPDLASAVSMDHHHMDSNNLVTMETNQQDSTPTITPAKPPRTLDTNSMRPDPDPSVAPPDAKVARVNGATEVETTATKNSRPATANSSGSSNSGGNSNNKSPVKSPTGDAQTGEAAICALWAPLALTTVCPH